MIVFLFVKIFTQQITLTAVRQPPEISRRWTWSLGLGVNSINCWTIARCGWGNLLRLGYNIIQNIYSQNETSGSVCLHFSFFIFQEFYNASLTMDMTRILIGLQFKFKFVYCIDALTALYTPGE